MLHKHVEKLTYAVKFKPKRGINASSIADISSIPRATVIRKLKSMEKKGFIKRNQRLEYTLGTFKSLEKRLSSKIKS